MLPISFEMVHDVEGASKSGSCTLR